MCSTLNSIFPFFFTLAATTFGFLLNQTWQKSKDKKERLQKIITLLGATENELYFYVGKLNELVNSLEEGFLEQEAGLKGVAVPSVNFFPAVLERARINMMEYQETAGVIGILGECHFELAHVQAKLEYYKMLAEKVRDSGGDHNLIAGMAVNSGGLKGLAKDNIRLFTEARTKIASAQNEVRQALKDFCGKSWFRLILRD
jgi:hypothetical protein